MPALTPAADAAERQYYAFQFDLNYDNQHAVILEYWYGNSKSDSWDNLSAEAVKMGKTASATSVTQMMPPGGLLYVKWRDTETQKVYEDNVDLRGALRSGDPGAVDAAVDLALGRKPRRHEFDLSTPATARHMSVTGG